MERSRRLYTLFLEQMQEMKNFRQQYPGESSNPHFEQNGSDLELLMEAMGLFAARTRKVSRDAVEAVHYRTFQQIYPFLLNPVPAMGMIRARPGSLFTETTVLPGGSEIAVENPQGETVFLRTVRDLRILPVRLAGTDLLLLPGGGFRLLLMLESNIARNDAPGTLSFCLDYLGDYLRSLRFFHLLKTHLSGAFVCYGGRADEHSRGKPAGVSFGVPSGDPVGMHPIEKERFFFHYPEQELFLNVALPESPRNWEKFTICLDLDRNWPAKTVINPQLFKLFCVPVENLRRDTARPISCNGMKDRYLVAHPDVPGGFRLQGITGVYLTGPDGSAPMHPGILSGKEGAYEILQDAEPAWDRKTWLSFNLGDAFENPALVFLEGIWHQPEAATQLTDTQRPQLFRRKIPGIDWELSGRIALPAESRFHEEMDVFLGLLSLKNRAVISREELICLFSCLGTVWTGKFAPIRELLEGLESVETVDTLKGARRIYNLVFLKLEPDFVPLVETFAAHAEAVLDAWFPNSAIEVTWESWPRTRAVVWETPLSG